MEQLKGLNLQEAADHAGTLFDDLTSCFVAEKKKLPSWGPDLDRDINRYIDGISHWPVVSLYWSFESPRYFGAPLEDVKRMGVAKLRPRMARTKAEEIFLYSSQKPTTVAVQCSFGSLVQGRSPPAGENSFGYSVRLQYLNIESCLLANCVCQSCEIIALKVRMIAPSPDSIRRLNPLLSCRNF